MKKIGLIGGLGPEATVEYYKQIIDAFKDGSGDLNYPEMIIYSVNLSELISLMKAQRYDQAADIFVRVLDRLKLAGAEFAAISANTPHMLFDRISANSPLPLISIVEAACREALRRGFRRPGLLGTGFTMDAGFYPDVFKKHGMEVLVPEKEDRDLINHKLFSEIELGVFTDETREQFIAIISKMARVQQIDSIILGCTEFGILLPHPVYGGIPALDTTKIHVREIVEWCLDKK